MADLIRRPKQAAPLRRSRQQERGPRTEHLAFVLAGEVYAAPVALIREILKPPPLTPVPRAPHATLGIVSVRGQLVTVIDLRRKLRLEEGPLTRKARILLVDAIDGEVMGVFVDEVLQVYRLAEDEVEPAAAALGGDVAGYIAGIARPLRPAAQRAAPLGPSEGAAGDPSAEAQLPRGFDTSVIILLDLRAVLSS